MNLVVPALEYLDAYADALRRGFYTAAQARMGVTVAQSILFVDDKAENVDAARAAGWRAMLYRGPESLADALAQWG